jgi:hypothetical protein
MFLDFSNYRKNKNIICEIQRNDISKSYIFKDIVELCLENFGQVYREDDMVNIVEVVKMTSFFPIFVHDLRNARTMEEITKEEF